METDKCPYCKKKLEKIPQRKKDCEFCGKTIYPRPLPNKDKRFLFTENELKRVEEEWTKYALSSKWFKIIEKWGVSKEDYLREQEILRQRFGFFPFTNDVFWSLFNNLLLECYKKGDTNKANLIHKTMDIFQKERDKK